RTSRRIGDHLDAIDGRLSTVVRVVADRLQRPTLRHETKRSGADIRLRIIDDQYARECADQESIGPSQMKKKRPVLDGFDVLDRLEPSCLGFSNFLFEDFQDRGGVDRRTVMKMNPRTQMNPQR